jgi:hypothetical protein
MAPMGILILILVQGLTVLAATELTAKSSLFGPVRAKLLEWGVLGTVEPDHWWSGLARFTSDAFTCPFCTSFWHAGWAAPWCCYILGDPLGLSCATYLPAVAVAKILHDRLTTHRPTHDS